MDLKRFTKSFGQMEKALVRAAHKAGRDGLRKARTEARRYAAGRKELKVSAIKKRSQELRPRGVNSFADLTWTLRIARKGTPLRDYPHKFVSGKAFRPGAAGGGVRVKVNKGAPVLIKSAFVATMKNGHYGIFLREPGWSWRPADNKLKRTGLPIRELFTTAPAEVLSDDAAVPAVTVPARAAFERTMDRLVPIEMSKVLK